MTNLIITGQTSTGKTDLALQVCSHFKKVGLVIADSRQLYRELPILSGLDMPELIPSHIQVFGPDLFSIDNPANVSQFSTKAHQFIDKLNQSGVPVLVVGGAGLYIDSLTTVMSTLHLPPITHLRPLFDQESLASLQARLDLITDSKSGMNHSDYHNPRRLIRRLEAAYSGISRSQEPRNLKYYWVGFGIDTQTLSDKIYLRIQDRLDHGVVEEVATILPKIDPSHPIYSTLGLENIARFIAGESSKSFMIESWHLSEMQYAKRQETWFHKKTQIVWYDHSTDRSKLSADLSKIIA
jgi:tRNA dimethylallyltransferase